MKYILFLLTASIHGMTLYYIAFFSYQRRKQQGKIPYVKSSELPEREKKKQKEKWRAASSAYRKRKKMANAVLDLTPPSMENTPPALVDADLAEEQPRVQPEIAGPAVVDAIPQNQDFNPPVSSTPQKDCSAVHKRCKRLQKDNCRLKKQVLYLRRQLAEVRKLKDKFKKSENKLLASQRGGPSETFKQRGGKKLAAERKQAVITFLSRDENSRLLPGTKKTTSQKIN